MAQAVLETYQVQPLARPIDARVSVPGSKSYTNRALVLAALARGKSVLEGALWSDDTGYMLGALRALGIPVVEDREQKTMTLTGCGGRPAVSSAKLFIGNAGTAARFLPPVLALGHGVFELDGTEAMRKRPIQPLLDALATLGSRASSLSGNGCPPIRIDAEGLRGGTAQLPGGVSSQYFSGLLMAAPYAERGISLEVVGDLVSKPYLEVTAQAMRAFGVELHRDGFQRFWVEPGRGYQGCRYSVEPDASAASYFFAAAAVTGGRVVVPGLGSGSLQGDLGFVRLLEQMGCTVRQTDNETEVVGPPDGRLRGIEVDMANLSDTAQTLAAIAPYADGPTRVTGIGFIRRKETDRVGAVVTELKRLGIGAEEEPDGFLIRPGRPKPGRVKTYDDHRMAMSFAVLGLKAEGIELEDPGCTAKTFPEFFQVLEGLYR